MFQSISKCMGIRRIIEKIQVSISESTYVENFSLEELNDFINSVTCIEKMALKNKGKLKMGYVNLITDLRWNLAQLYEDRIIKSRLPINEIDKNIEDDISNDIYNIKKLRYQHDYICRYKKNNKFSIYKILNKIKFNSHKKHYLNNVKRNIQSFIKKATIKSNNVKRNIQSFIKKATIKSSNVKRNIQSFIKKITINNNNKKIVSTRVKKSLFIRTALFSLILFTTAGTFFLNKNDNKLKQSKSNCSKELESNDNSIKLDNSIILEENLLDKYEIEDTEIKHMEQFFEVKIIGSGSNIENINPEDEIESITPEDEIESITPEGNEQNNIPEDDILPTSIADNINSENGQLLDNTNEDNRLLIGKNVKVLEDSVFYGNMYDAYFNDNQLKPLYSDAGMVRTIASIVVSDGTDLKNINANDELSSYMEKGYAIIACSVINEYSNNNVIEGYYRLESIKAVDNKVLSKNINNK